MDPYGSIHVLDEEDEERRKLIERLNGKLVDIKDGDVEEVALLNREQRRKLYRDLRRAQS